MENLCQLLFEVSNEDRLRILRQLKTAVMNITSLSKTLRLTLQECSRHVSRLGAVGLVEKGVDGAYQLTPYGGLALKQLTGVEFASQHRDYFTAHVTRTLPRALVSRIGELADSTYTAAISTVFYNIDKVIREANEYIVMAIDQYLMSSNALIAEALDRGVRIQNIETYGRVVPPKILQEWWASDAIRQSVYRARTTGLLEERVSERVDAYLWMSEKEVAVIAFPLPDGRFDYLGFTATDNRSHTWCRDLFYHYWERASPRARVVERLYKWVKTRPKVAEALQTLVAGKELKQTDVISELETKSLLKQGTITLLGLFLYQRLQQ
jgi:predicted transcriptional regulator